MTINCKGNLVDLSSPKVMGILNITPDSFYDGGRYKNKSEIISKSRQMIIRVLKIKLSLLQAAFFVQ